MHVDAVIHAVVADADSRAMDAEVDDATVDDATVDDAKVDAAKVDAAKVDGAKVDGAKVDDAKVNDDKIDDAKIGDARIGDAKIDDAKIHDAEVDAKLDGNVSSKFDLEVDSKVASMVDPNADVNAESQVELKVNVGVDAKMSMANSVGKIDSDVKCNANGDACFDVKKPARVSSRAVAVAVPTDRSVAIDETASLPGKRPRSKRIIVGDKEPALVVASSLVEKKSRRKVAVGGPKRPATSFMLFMANRRSSLNESLIVQGMEVNLLETSKIGSRMWRNMSVEEKEPFVSQANELHAEWLVKKAAYVEADRGEEEVFSMKKPKVQRDPEEPRRPPSSFVIFMNKNRAIIKTTLAAENSKSTVTDVGRRGGELWSQLDAEERAEYTSAFADLNAKYKVAMSSYLASKAFDSN
jgi:hypothetical protein